MKENQLKIRMQTFALDVVRLVQKLPRDSSAQVIGRQLLRSGTSVGANYRAACRARSRAEFIAKMGIVEEEADETIYWMELLEAAGVVPGSFLASLKNEAQELLSITIASIKTARSAKTK